MPTVPPTYIQLRHDSDVIVGSTAVVSDYGDAPSSPTPDPDLDDGLLVPVVVGDGIGAISSDSSLALKDPAQSAGTLKPRLSLSDLSLHSPSSILGTPFDVSPRFEYPFPLSSSIDSDMSLPPSIHSFASHFNSFPPSFSLSGMGAVPSSSLSMPRTDIRSISPTHPKHNLRDPPVPPTLAAKKRWSMGVGPSLKHHRKRSHSAGIPLAPDDDVPKSSTSPSKKSKEPRGRGERRSFGQVEGEPIDRDLAGPVRAQSPTILTTQQHQDDSSSTTSQDDDPLQSNAPFFERCASPEPIE